MADQTETTTTGDSGEIDLEKLLQLFRKGLKRIFRGILHLFLYLKKNAFKLVALIAIGIAIALLLTTFVDKKLKTEVIVKPNFASKDYLYDVIDEIQANIRSKDTLFFNDIGIDISGMRGFEVSIEPIENKEIDKEKTKQNNEYLEILQNYKDNDFVLEAIRSEVLKKAVLTHRITFSHKNPEKGEEYVTKLMRYINDNPYFTEIKRVSTENAESRIAENTELIGQIDELVANYAKQLAADNRTVGREGMVLFDEEKEVDVTALLALKNRLIKEIEEKRMEVSEQKEAINIINFGKAQVVKKQFLNKSLFMVPAILLGMFFAWSLLVYLNRKSQELIEQS